MRSVTGEVVEFEGELGRARALWKGARPPRLEQDEHVELNIDAEVALEPCDSAPSFQLEGDHTVVVAKVESRDDDGSLVLRLTFDGLVLHSPRAPLDAKTLAVRARCTTQQLTLWPFEV
ncbi:MAG: hypothetical protein QM817_29775 [Archangium sp.]